MRMHITGDFWILALPIIGPVGHIMENFLIDAHYLLQGVNL